MKTQILLISLLLLLIAPAASAQITEDDKSMSQGIKNAMILELPDMEEKFVEKLWKKYIKPYGGKTRRNKKADEWFTDDADIVDIGGSNTVDLYARAAELGDDVELILWVDMGGAFLSSAEHPDRYTEGEKLLMRFALFVAKEQTKMELEAEEKKLKKLKSSLKKLERDNDRYHRDIENAKERIRKAEENIVVNEQEQDGARKQIELQQETIEDVRQRLSDF
ncbi:MAG: hypothetical protein AAFP19_11140 [Bacteroidota bacterium]